ncbi:MAG: GGDEF domain-containing protein [Actinomycetales bacterium]|nr:GGDEF domain-containing protein [Actinomycetales bacterium]
MTRARRVLLGYATLLLTLGAACLVGDDTSRSGAVLASTVLAILALAGARPTTHAPRRTRLAHIVLLAGLGLLAQHDTQGLLSRATGHGEPPGALFAATLTLGYLAILAGGTLATMPIGSRDLGAIIDSAIIAVVATVLVWTAVIDPVQERHGAPHSEQAYELVIILLVGGMAGVVIRAWTANAQARGATGYLLLAVLAVFAGHMVAVLSHNPATGADSPWIDVWWVAAYLGLGAAYRHPAADLMGASNDRSARLTRGRLVLLGLALTVLPAAAVVEAATGRHWDPLPLSLASALLAPLVLGRIATLASLHAQAERRLHELATRDELTGLPNRRAVSQHLTALLAEVADRRSAGVVVLFLDLDDFKVVNDNHGHTTGDSLLIEVGRRLRAAMRASDVVARFGGDEFVVVMQGPPARTRDAAIATLTAALAEPVALAGLEASARASIGAALVEPGEHASAGQVLSAADAAMYVVKREHRAAPARIPTPPASGDDALENAVL